MNQLGKQRWNFSVSVCQKLLSKIYYSRPEVPNLGYMYPCLPRVHLPI